MKSVGQPAPAFVLWIKYAIIVVSNAVLIFYLVRDGVSPFEILVLAALEVCAAISIHPFAVALHRLRTDMSQPPRQGRPPIFVELIKSLGALLFLYVVMGLFPLLVWLVTDIRPEGPEFLENPAFMQAALMLGVLLAGRLLVEMLEAASGRFDETEATHLGPALHYFVALFAVAAGSVTILVLDLPTTTLVVFLVVRTAADLLIARYLSNNSRILKVFRKVR